MDRQIVYPGAIPLDTDILSIQRNTMVALGYLAQAAFGTGTVVDGLMITPTAPASLVVNIGPGSIIALSTIDATAFGSLASDSTDPLVKIGVNAIGSTSFTLTAPATSGQSINYLIEATFQEADSSAVVLPYYNASNPAAPYSGPANSGTAQNTQRLQRVQLQLKAGAAAVTGTQTTPAVDAGWVGLYVVTVNYGQTQITSANLTNAQLATAPFIPAKLGPGMFSGFSNTQVFDSSGTFTVPAGVFKVQAEVWGGGGGGGFGGASTGGAGGAGGGYAKKTISGLTPGSAITVTVGAGGAGGTGGSGSASGGTSSFGAYVSATGGTAGANNSGLGVAGGAGTGGDENISGGEGMGALAVSPVVAGSGGDAARGGSGGGWAVTIAAAGIAPGGGGSGGANTNSGGGGAHGRVVVRY